MTLEPPSAPPSILRRFEAEFLRPYRGAILLGLLGLVVQSVLLLPVPLLQGWVVDRLGGSFRVLEAATSPETPGQHAQAAGDAPQLTLRAHAAKASVAWAILVALAATILLH